MNGLIEENSFELRRHLKQQGVFSHLLWRMSHAYECPPSSLPPCWRRRVAGNPNVPAANEQDCPEISETAIAAGSLLLVGQWSQGQRPTSRKEAEGHEEGQSDRKAKNWEPGEKQLERVIN